MNKLVRYTTVIVALVLSAVFSSAMAMRRDWDYRIKLTKNTGGLDIAVQTFVGPAATVGFDNRSTKTARCSASFVSYPHAPSQDEILTVKIPAGKRATLAYPAAKLGGNFSTVFVDVKCAERKAPNATRN